MFYYRKTRNINAGGRGEAGAMYDQGDQEDKDIAAEQDRAAQLREELPEEDDADMPSLSPSAATRLPGTGNTFPFGMDRLSQIGGICGLCPHCLNESRYLL